jgi:hypothetical protein
LKLAPILAQYLYTNKRLTLQGIGMFQSAPSAYVETTHTKNSKEIPTENISFQNDPSAKLDEELVKYISGQTGKMRALALSDLESYIELMQQFLNIGKPFQLEGIGTLTKIRNQEYGFSQGDLLNEKIIETTEKQTSKDNSGEDSTVSFSNLYKKNETPGFTLKKASIAFLLFGGIGLAIWGGYALYSKNQRPASVSAEETPAQQVVPVEDSIKYTVQKKEDSLSEKVQINNPAPGYKFVFESTPNKKRAIKRFNFLKNINSDIHLETSDSSLFKITVNLNIPPSDTLRIKDSLNSWYYGKKDILVKIESNNNSNKNVP